MQIKPFIKTTNKMAIAFVLSISSDPNFYYLYKFSMSDNSKIFSYKSIYCTIYNHQNVEVGVTGESDAVRYPPLDKDV